MTFARSTERERERNDEHNAIVVSSIVAVSPLLWGRSLRLARCIQRRNASAELDRAFERDHATGLRDRTADDGTNSWLRQRMAVLNEGSPPWEAQMDNHSSPSSRPRPPPIASPSRRTPICPLSPPQLLPDLAQEPWVAGTGGVSATGAVAAAAAEAREAR